MRLAEMMALRQEICAGLLVTLTERCPLHCAHCSASAALNGRHLDGVALLRFVRTFTAQCRPDVMMLTGGEPLLRPRLVVETARAAKAAGTRTAVLSGAFFAGGGRIPAPIRPAIQAVDHVSLSLDVFHEREVARRDVFAVLRALLRHGITTSLHIAGTGPEDPYLSEVTAEVTRIFGTDVPMLVSEFKPIGRATAWARATPRADNTAAPCAMAAWPVVTIDATVVVCCNQDVVDGRTRPDHLRLGVLATSTWPEVHERAHSSPVLRMIRTVGPLHISRCGGTDLTDYCGSCQRLAPGALDWATQAGTGPAGELLQAVAVRNGQMGGPRALLRRHGVARYAHLVGDDA